MRFSVRLLGCNGWLVVTVGIGGVGVGGLHRRPDSIGVASGEPASRICTCTLVGMLLSVEARWNVIAVVRGVRGVFFFCNDAVETVWNSVVGGGGRCVCCRSMG